MDSANNISARHLSSKPGYMYRWLINRLKKLPLTTIELVRPDGVSEKLGESADNVPVARIRINSHKGILKAINGGMLGWAEAYIAGDWDTPDLFAVTDWAMANERVLESAFSGTSLMRAINRLIHLLRPNSRRGSKKNIEAHYDLGNDFYQVWLDKSMTYSSALYKKPDESLERAQSHKYLRIKELLEVADHQDLLEIGCGWGGFAETVFAEHHLNSYKGITLSHEQLRYARKRMNETTDRYQFSLQDYRDISEQYDRIVSIEMIEAVGEECWPAYFSCLTNSLRPGGLAVIQAITIADERFDHYRSNTDFIQKYIFPGGFLPSDQAVRTQADQAGLSLVHTEPFGLDYARTLRSWHHKFNQGWPLIARQGFDERFRRMWNFYFAYCQAGFNAGSIDVRLYLLKKDDLY